MWYLYLWYLRWRDQDLFNLNNIQTCFSVQVMQVVREQITRTLSSKPTSLELFKNKVNALNYSEILKLRQTERLHQEETLAPPVLWVPHLLFFHKTGKLWYFLTWALFSHLFGFKCLLGTKPKKIEISPILSKDTVAGKHKTAIQCNPIGLSV